MTKIIICGCNGKMGRAITDFVKHNQNVQIVAGVDITGEKLAHYPVYTSIAQVEQSADIIFDFSRPDSLPELLDYACGKKLALLIATTGHSVHQLQLVDKAAKEIAIFATPNLSIGVYFMTKIASDVARRLEAISLQTGAEPFDVEIVEKHHNKKVDAPSGTAMKIASDIMDSMRGEYECVFDRHNVRQKRGRSEIGIHSVRGGTITGEHTVIFAGNNETLEIKHQAQSSMVFASGALAAAGFLLKQQPGLYGMSDLIPSTY